MLPFKHRLTEEKEIIFSLRSRYFQNSKFFKLVLSRSKVKDFRFCFIISKKIFKKANKRNRIRRRVKAIIKNTLDSNQFKLQYFNCVVQCFNKEGIKFDSKELESEILNLMRLALDKTKNNISKGKTNSTKPNNPSRISSSVEQ